MRWWIARRLRSTDWAVRAHAVRDLVRIGALKPLVKLCERESDPSVLEPVITALARSGDLALVASATQRLCSRGGPLWRHVEWLFRNETRNLKMLAAAARVAAPMADPPQAARLVEPLLRFHQEPGGTSDTRSKVLEIVALFGSGGVPSLLTALRERGAARYDIIELLGELRDRRAVGDLIHLMEELGRDPAVAVALGKIGSADAVGPLQKVLVTNGNASPCRAAVEALARIDAPSSTDALQSTLEHALLEVRMVAAAALVKRKVAPPADLVVKLLVDFASSRNERSFNQWAGEARDYAAPSLFNHRPAAIALAAHAGVPGDVVVAALQALGSQVGRRMDDRQYGGEVLDMDTGFDAVRRLCASDSRFTTAVLQRIAQRQDVVIKLQHDCAGARDAAADFAPWRQLARQTLIRRGVPA